MSKIVIGTAGTQKATIDVDKLLRTRMLIQANSGKGKSWLLRRIAEQLFGKCPVIIIDPEGEFATLREKYGYVLVGKGGDTPADPRSAALLAHKLLELRASAVCDIFELKPNQRHEWVEKFLDALIDAPKNLWHPCVVMVDEAHTFCPEKGSGESTASEAMISLATRGRKRGFASIFATQRLGKLRKDAAAELLNVMIGGTFIDIDRKRAADALGVYGADQHKFFDEIKVLERGTFFALGPAISNDRLLVTVGPVETTHPEAGSAKHAAEPPPAPEKVKAMLPKLADLPKTAEEKARTEAELKKEIRELKAQLRSQPVQKLQPAAADSKAIAKAVMTGTKIYRDMLVQQARSFNEIAVLLNRIAVIADREKSRQLPEQISPQTPAAPQDIAKQSRPLHLEINQRSNGEPGELTPRQIGILKAIAEFEAIGRTSISKPWIAARSGASYTSSAYTNNLGSLRSGGYITYPGDNLVALTDKGREAAGEVRIPQDSAELFKSCMNLLVPAQQRILKVLYASYPEALSKTIVAEYAGASATSSAFTNNLGSLKSAGMIEYPEKGSARCASWMFID